MLPAVPAQVVQHPGCALGDLAADGGFAVQDAHGVFLQTLPAGLTQLLPAPLEIRPQRLVVFRPAGGAADGIDGKGQVLQPQGLHSLPRQGDDLGIGDGPGGAVTFHPELVELAVAPPLCLFIAEAVEYIADLEGQGIAQQPVFNGRPADAGSPLRAQGNGTVALIGKGVHFFIYHIGGIAHAAQEQLGMLKGGGADFAVAVQRRRGKQGALDILPAGGLGGEKIIGAAGAGGEDGHRGTSFLITKWRHSAGLWFILSQLCPKGKRVGGAARFGSAETHERSSCRPPQVGGAAPPGPPPAQLRAVRLYCLLPRLPGLSAAPWRGGTRQSPALQRWPWPPSPHSCGDGTPPGGWGRRDAPQ